MMNKIPCQYHSSDGEDVLNIDQDIGLELSQRAQKKVDKYLGGYQAHGMRHAFLRAIVSTSGRTHGELLRLLYLLEADVDSEVYCWHRSEFIRRMRALPSATLRD